MTKFIKVKKPNRATVEEMAKETISCAIETYDIKIAQEASATFRTHLGRKARARVTDYVRALEKASRNELNTSDEEFASVLEANIDVDVDISMPDYHSTDKSVLEQNRNMEWE